MAETTNQEAPKVEKGKVSTLLSIKYEEDEIRDSRVKNKLVDLLIYGISGAAKTPLLSSVLEIPELDKPIFIDIESGAHAAYAKGIEVIEFAQYHALNCKQARSKNPTEEDSLFKLIDDLAKAYDSRKDEPPFNCILFDGWTESYNIIHAQAIIDGSGDKEVGTQNDRMRAFARIKRLSRILRKIPVHIISTAREYTFSSSGSGGSVTILSRGPHLSGATMNYVAAQSDIVARVRFVGTQLQFSVKEDSVTIARDRFYLLPDQIKMAEPSLVEVWKYLRGDLKRGKS